MTTPPVRHTFVRSMRAFSRSVTSVTLRRTVAATVAFTVVASGALLASGPAAAIEPKSARSAATETAAAGPLSVGSLRTNSLVDPLGIAVGSGTDAGGTSAPTFSWKTTSADRGVLQEAYEVRVASTEDALPSADVWSSGKVESSAQLGIRYDGPALTSQTRYVWQAKVWSTAGGESGWSAPASFETAFLSSDEWSADWIGGPDANVELAKWSDYTVSVDFTMDNLVLGLYARATDLRNAYMLQLSVADGTPRYRPHTKVDDRYSLLESKDISSVISADALKTGRHTFSVTFTGSEIVASIDGAEIDRRTDTSQKRGFVGFRQSIATEGSENATIHSVRVTGADATTLLDADFQNGSNPFTGGTVVDGALKLVAPTEAIYRSTASAPILRKELSLDAEAHGGITVARVHAAARGVYELTLNGEKVGDEHLAPGWTNYNKRIDSQTYDVTSMLQEGDNAFGAMLGDGWYAGHIASFGPHQWGTDPSLIAELHVTYADGTTQVIGTDDSWRTTSGPFTQADLIMGEDYDARLAHIGWTNAGYDDSAWSAAGIAAGGAEATALVEPQTDEPVRTTEERTPISRTESAPGTWIYDLGQNMVGVARLELTGVVDTKATIRYGEMLNPDGTLYTANLRSAKATDTYTFAATGTAEYTPTFTFHGFRYLEITGVTEPPSIEQVTGLVWGSDLASTGSLETSSDMLNQLQSNITWGQRGNFLSIPTDTPARDERLGWTGDINVFAPTASYNQDTLAFLSKWLVDLEDAQGSNGDLPGVAPFGNCCGGGTGWSDAGVTVPYTLWRSYGDTGVIDRSYPMMKRFMDFVESSTGPSLIRTSGGYGDWLHLDDPTDGGLLGTAYYAYIANQMSEMAAAVGKKDDAAHYADLAKRVAAAFAAKYVANDGTVQGNSQTGYAIAIGMGLVPADRLQAVGDKYVAKIASRDNHLSTGFLGTPWLLPALTATGHQDLAYQLLNNDTFPSWGYEVKSGATTMWERWDSLKPDGSFGDVGMNSFNHYAYGAVGDWMYRNIGGIQATGAGYKTFDVAPTPGGGLTHGRGAYESVYGPIVSEWTTTDAGLDLNVSVPVNTTATVRVPALNRWAVTEGGVPLGQAAGVSVVSESNGVVTLSVGSGDYRFSSDPANSGLVVDVVPQGSADRFPGERIDGVVRVTNTGTVPVTGFTAELTVTQQGATPGTPAAALVASPSTVSTGEVLPGERIELAFGVDLPQALAPGSVSVSVAVVASVSGEVQRFTKDASLVTVLPAVTIDAITAVPAPGSGQTTQPSALPENAEVTAALSNVSPTALRGRVVVDGPSGWPAPLPSEEVILPAGGSADGRVTVAIPLSVDAGAQQLTVRFVSENVTMATAGTSFDLALATPPGESERATDHVDFGDNASEAAHAVKTSGNGGATSEAGFTRRYSGLTKVGSWFEATLAVTPNEPFIIRSVETYDQAQVKSYDILVNGTVVAQRLHQRSAGGPGTQTYQVLVPDDGTLTSSGKVTVQFRFNGLGSHDPSIADTWVLPVPADTMAPSVQLDVSHPGANGWYQGGAAATVQAADARSGIASIEVATDDGEWRDYTDPIALAEGATTLRFRATDTAGNTSEVRTETLRTDGVKPTAWGWLAPARTVVGFAQDGGSPADASGPGRLEYSLDGTTWQQGLSALLAVDASPKSLSVRAVDVAGNRSDVLDLTPQQTPPALPVLRGAPVIVEANGFPAGRTVRVEIHSDPVLLGTAVADALGVVSVRGTVPADLPEGQHRLVFALVAEPGEPGEGGTGGGGAGGGVTVPIDVLSSTGANVLPWAIGAGALLLLGGVLIVLRRRSRLASPAESSTVQHS
ncbi:family 78 glycoside hydrolase catalytic domain [Plantibacter sp. YIM 135249]|uniref:family 78 glycoside hydrolase catalytic domain n=1 Tax=Plantibacter sp. YIM 135249 TaxID=3423918 RepID=UPI003D34840D